LSLIAVCFVYAQNEPTDGIADSSHETLSTSQWQSITSSWCLSRHLVSSSVYLLLTGRSRPAVASGHYSQTAVG